MMKLVYKLQAEDYKFDFPVSYLPVSKPWGESCAWAETPDSGCSGGRWAGAQRGCHSGRENAMVSVQGQGGITNWNF